MEFFSFKILSSSGGRAQLPLKATPIGVEVKIRPHFENTDTFFRAVTEWEHGDKIFL